MESGEWLQTMLRQRDLSTPDGRPLYGYRCSAEEFETLGGVLSALPFYQVVRSLWTGHCACFCVYAAEWWRRNHEGGPWRWRDILIAIDWEQAELPQLYPIIQEGLVAYWRRDLLTLWGKRAFLVTLACEGGLPLRLLHRQQTRLRRYFHDLLQEFSIFGRSGLTPSDLAARVGDRLPASLRHDVVYELSGRLTSRIWQLQLEVGDSRTPVATLDRKQPTWRESLPLVVEDDTARVLLNNLIEDASRIAFRRTAGISMKRHLRKSGQEWYLEGEIRSPGRVPAADLAAMLGVRSEALPARFQLVLDDDVTSSSLFALATHLGVGDAESRYVIEVPPRTVTLFHGLEATRERGVVAVSSGLELGRIDVAGGGSLDELPWAFVESAADRELLDYIGQGSLKSRHPVVLLALESSWRISDESRGEWEQVGSLAVVGRSLWRVSGAIHVVDDDGNRCQVESGAASDEASEFRLTGTPLPYSVGTTPLLLGAPTIYQRKAGGIMDPVDHNCVEWKQVSGGKGWQRLGPACLGDVRIRVVSNGEVKFRTRVQVLPETAAFELLPGRSGRDGRLRLRGLRNADVGIEPLEYVQTTLTNTAPKDGQIDVDFTTEREPPAAVTCCLNWQGGQQLRLRIPFPVRVGRYLGREGTVFKRDAIVCVDQLVGIQASVVDADQNGRFVLEGRMHANDISAEIAHALWIHTPLTARDDRRHELDLGRIQEPIKSMMALTKDLDALFSLKITSSSTSLPPRALYVSRYDWLFEFAFDSGEVRLNEKALQSVCPDDLAGIHVEARPLWDGSAEPVTLQPTGIGRWLFEPQHRTPGPWLILAWDGTWCRARPSLWNVTGEVEGTKGGPLAEVARIANREARSAAFDALIGQMAEDPDHPEWESFFEYIDSYEGVPKNALTLFDRFVDNHDAVALALLLASSDRFDRVWYALEELPFWWALVPLSSWVRGARRLLRSLETAKLSSNFIASAFEPFFTRAPARLQALGVAADLVARLVLPDHGEPLKLEPPLALAKSQQSQCQRTIESLQGDLFRALAEEHWPPGPNVAEFCRILGNTPRALNRLWFEPPAGVGYQAAVLNTPIAIALSSACGVSLDRLRICEIRRLRDFAPDYVDRASAYALSWAAGLLHEAAPELLG